MPIFNFTLSCAYIQCGFKVKVRAILFPYLEKYVRSVCTQYCPFGHHIVYPLDGLRALPSHVRRNGGSHEQPFGLRPDTAFRSVRSCPHRGVAFHDIHDRDTFRIFISVATMSSSLVQSIVHLICQNEAKIALNQQKKQKVMCLYANNYSQRKCFLKKIYIFVPK